MGKYRQRILIKDILTKMMHQCYYCEQLFDTKEQLYEHVEIHSDIERNKEIMERKKEEKSE